MSSDKAEAYPTARVVPDGPADDSDSQESRDREYAASLQQQELQGVGIATARPAVAVSSSAHQGQQPMQGEDAVQQPQEPYAVAMPVHSAGPPPGAGGGNAYAGGGPYLLPFGHPPPPPFGAPPFGPGGDLLLPHEHKILELHALGRAIKTLAILDGLILFLNCIWWPVLWLFMFWGPVSGYIAAHRFSIQWFWVFMIYYVARISMDLGLLFAGSWAFFFVLFFNLLCLRYIMRFGSLLYDCSPTELQTLRNADSSAWVGERQSGPGGDFF